MLGKRSLFWIFPLGVMVWFGVIAAYSMLSD
jgi:hypothetical protein